jgi:hypothetical protein
MRDDVCWIEDMPDVIDRIKDKTHGRGRIAASDSAAGCERRGQRAFCKTMNSREWEGVRGTGQAHRSSTRYWTSDPSRPVSAHKRQVGGVELLVTQPRLFMTIREERFPFRVLAKVSKANCRDVIDYAAITMNRWQSGA